MTKRAIAVAACGRIVRLAVLVVTLLLVCACDREDPEAAFRAQQAADDAAAFDKAVRGGEWLRAKELADDVMARYPGTTDAKRIAEQYPSIAEKAERARVDALWGYDEFSVTGGVQRSAAIFAKDEVDVDGSGPTAVRLIFRDHPSWGRSSYLVLKRGDFNCYGGCKVAVTVDEKPARQMAASRPKTDEAIAMFIEDERALWRMTQDAKIIAIEFPAKGMGKRTVVFEIGGLDRARMPGWN